MIGCLGGFCMSRGKCANYHATDARTIIERLCPMGEEEVTPMTKESLTDALEQGETN